MKGCKNESAKILSSALVPLVHLCFFKAIHFFAKSYFIEFSHYKLKTKEKIVYAKEKEEL